MKTKKMKIKGFLSKPLYLKNKIEKQSKGNRKDWRSEHDREVKGWV